MTKIYSARDLQTSLPRAPQQAKDFMDLYEVKLKAWPEDARWQPAYEWRGSWQTAPADWVCRLKDAVAPVEDGVSDDTAAIQALSGEARTAPAPAPDTLAATLAARGKEYGDFGDFALLVQALKTVTRKHRKRLKRPPLTPLQQEGLDMMLHKIGRIVNGNPDNEDSWRDAAGYATCVADRLKPDASRP